MVVALSTFLRKTWKCAHFTYHRTLIIQSMRADDPSLSIPRTTHHPPFTIRKTEWDTLRRLQDRDLSRVIDPGKTTTLLPPQSHAHLDGRHTENFEATPGWVTDSRNTCPPATTSALLEFASNSRDFPKTKLCLNIFGLHVICCLLLGAISGSLTRANTRTHEKNKCVVQHGQRSHHQDKTIRSRFLLL